MRITEMVWLLLLTFAVQGLESGCNQKQPSECKEFFAMSIEQQEAQFRTFNLERQLKTFRCGMERRPPEIGLAYDIAKGGEKIVPALTEALVNEKDEWMQNAIIDIFRVMSNDGYLRGKMEVVQQIRDTVSRMKISRIKKEAEESLNEIERNASRSK